MHTDYWHQHQLLHNMAIFVYRIITESRNYTVSIILIYNVAVAYW